jgi:hypothetical protein
LLPAFYQLVVTFSGSAAGVVQPSFSPLGNTVVDNDRALIRMQQWQELSLLALLALLAQKSASTDTCGAEQEYSMHTNQVKVLTLRALLVQKYKY